MNILVIIGSAVSLLVSFSAIVVVIANLKSNVDALNKQEERMTAKIEDSTRDITHVLVEVKSFISEQTVINKYVAKSLESVVNRCEECRDQGTQQDGVAALLAEILKHKKIVDIE